MKLQIRDTKDADGEKTGECYVAIVAANGEDWFVSESYSDEAGAFRSAIDFAEHMKGIVPIERIGV